MEAAIFGLIGAFIGSMASIGGIYIQQLHQSRHERLKMAVDLATKEYQHDIELAKAYEGTAYIAPLSSYVIAHNEYLERISKGSISPEAVKEISEKINGITEAFPGGNHQ